MCKTTPKMAPYPWCHDITQRTHSGRGQEGSEIQYWYWPQPRKTYTFICIYNSCSALEISICRNRRGLSKHLKQVLHNRRDEEGICHWLSLDTIKTTSSSCSSSIRKFEIIYCFLRPTNAKTYGMWHTKTNSTIKLSRSGY